MLRDNYGGPGRCRLAGKVMAVAVCAYNAEIKSLRGNFSGIIRDVFYIRAQSFKAGIPVQHLTGFSDLDFHFSVKTCDNIF